MAEKLKFKERISGWWSELVYAKESEEEPTHFYRWFHKSTYYSDCEEAEKMKNVDYKAFWN